MDKELNKQLIRSFLECKYGCAYVYARYPECKWVYRRYFNIYGSKRMYSCVRDFRSQGFLVNIWRPQLRPL